MNRIEKKNSWTGTTDRNGCLEQLELLVLTSLNWLIGTRQRHVWAKKATFEEVNGSEYSLSVSIPWGGLKNAIKWGWLELPDTVQSEKRGLIMRIT